MSGAVKKEERRSDEDRLLKVDEVAARLRLSKSAVYNLLSRGLIPFIDLACGKKHVPRVRESDLEKFIGQRLIQVGGNT